MRLPGSSFTSMLLSTTWPMLWAVITVSLLITSDSIVVSCSVTIALFFSIFLSTHSLNRNITVFLLTGLVISVFTFVDFFFLVTIDLL